MSTSERFQAAVCQHLQLVTGELVTVLRKLIEHTYPAEVVALDFEVFPDSFTDGFPVRAFFMDKDNCEFFVYVDGQPSYPSPVNPELLNIAKVYAADLEEGFLDEDPDLDTFTLAGECTIPWFAKCWVTAGGATFGRNASIKLHDDARSFDLVRNRWDDK